MPEHLRALVVVLVLATLVFAFAKAPACAMASTIGDFERRRNLWFAITIAAFLAHNIWIFVVTTGALLLLALSRETNKLAMYFFLLFAAPILPAEITGLGIIRYFFSIDYVRLLALTVLLPMFLQLQKDPDVDRFGRLLPDRFLVGYLVLQFLLMLTVSTFTGTLREGIFYAFIDVVLPYYVASRSLKNLPAFRDALMSFVLAALTLAAIGFFEFSRHWLLYASLDDVYGANRSIGLYLSRGEGGELRALASTGHSIVLGYVIAVATGLFLYFRKSVPGSMVWHFGLAALIAGLIAPLSRGPWVGAAAMLLIFIAAGPSPVKDFAKLGLAGLIVIPVLLVTSAGQEIIDHLPFVGTVDAGSVTYRQRLLEISIQVILQNPLFGAFDYMYSSAMQELKQGQGIIDVVNSYLGVGLSSGLIGLSLFAGFFITVAIGIFKGMKNLGDKNDERYLLGRTLLSVLLAVMVIIFTVSSVLFIPVVYWSMAGLGVAYARMLALEKSPGRAQPASFQPVIMKPGSYLSN